MPHFAEQNRNRCSSQTQDTDNHKMWWGGCHQLYAQEGVPLCAFFRCSLCERMTPHVPHAHAQPQTFTNMRRETHHNRNSRLTNPSLWYNSGSRMGLLIANCWGWQQTLCIILGGDSHTPNPLQIVGWALLLKLMRGSAPQTPHIFSPSALIAIQRWRQCGAQ